MKKTCKQCGRVVRGKPKSFDYYYFCRNDTCLKNFIKNRESERFNRDFAISDTTSKLQ